MLVLKPSQTYGLRDPHCTFTKARRSLRSARGSRPSEDFSERQTVRLELFWCFTHQYLFNKTGRLVKPKNDGNIDESEELLGNCWDTEFYMIFYDIMIFASVEKCRQNSGMVFWATGPTTAIGRNGRNSRQ